MRGDNSDRRRRAAGETGCSMCRLRGVLNGALASISDGDGEESVGGERDGSKRQVDARLSQSTILTLSSPGTPELRRRPSRPLLLLLTPAHCTLHWLDTGHML